MRMWLDTEFNEYNGQTISIGIVAEDGSEFYEVLEMHETPTKWVAENVMPLLRRAPLKLAELQKSLDLWLSQFDLLQIFVDHIADGYRFFKLLETDQQGGYLDVPGMMIIVVKDLPGSQRHFSDVEHHALSDARALKQRYQMKAAKIMEERENG